ncbi:hypothetical protein CL621_04560 [archaeon]|nr:hypothetical protein [archaeon]|tara:strand:- start:1434 stop:1835 length:402 start_codon:yes stop_codon:yes gene_type:complete
MKINKKAAASLIAWVLLVGLTVTLAGVVTNWAIKNARRFEPSKFAGPDIYCGDVAISLEVNDGDKYIKNRGSLIIKNFRCIPEEGEPTTIENVNLKPMDEIPNPCEGTGEIIPGVESSEGEVVYCPMKGAKIE